MNKIEIGRANEKAREIRPSNGEKVRKLLKMQSIINVGQSEICMTLHVMDTLIPWYSQSQPVHHQSSAPLSLPASNAKNGITKSEK